jgi:hypothetical protein
VIPKGSDCIRKTSTNKTAGPMHQAGCSVNVHHIQA